MSYAGEVLHKILLETSSMVDYHKAQKEKAPTTSPAFTYHMGQEDAYKAQVQRLKEIRGEYDLDD